MQDASTSLWVMEWFSEDGSFLALSKAEGEALSRRDDEDGEKLQKGIDMAIDRGVLLPMQPMPKYRVIDVCGKSPDDICDFIVRDLGGATGAVVVLCGLSGTGKGTAVQRLQERLPQATTWSNGNCFRALTRLATLWCDIHGLDDDDSHDFEKALSPENVAAFMKMLTFDRFGETWDILIDGLGYRARVSDVVNTDLKGPAISRHIPTVAKETQGQVVKFANAAVNRMKDAGLIVILEGREETVNYIESP